MFSSDTSETERFQFRNFKIVYRRYAGLYFCICVDITDNNLYYLEAIHNFVEVGSLLSYNLTQLSFISGAERVLPQRLRAWPGFQLLQGLHCRRRDVPCRRDPWNVADKSAQTTSDAHFSRIDANCLLRPSRCWITCRYLIYFAFCHNLYSRISLVIKVLFIWKSLWMKCIYQSVMANLGRRKKRNCNRNRTIVSVRMNRWESIQASSSGVSNLEKLDNKE